MQPGEGTEDTKRRVPYHELLPGDPARAAAVHEVVEALAARDARLITTDKTGGADGAVEVAHEALIRGWKQLRQWIDADRAGLRTQRRLTEAAQQWAEAAPESKDDFLYTGARLAVASEWARSHASDLSRVEEAFLAASQEAERHEREKEIDDARRFAEAEAVRARQAEQIANQAQKFAEQQRRLGHRFLVAAAVAGLLAVIAGGLGFWANSARESAETARDEKGKRRPRQSKQRPRRNNSVFVRRRMRRSRRNRRRLRRGNRQPPKRTPGSPIPVVWSRRRGPPLPIIARRSLILAVEAVKATRDHNEPVMSAAQTMLQEGLSNVGGKR